MEQRQEEEIQELENLVNETKFKLTWNGGEYKVNKPNIDTQEVVPLDVVNRLLNTLWGM